MPNIHFWNFDSLLLIFFEKSLTCPENIEKAYGSFRAFKIRNWQNLCRGTYSDRLTSWGWDRVRNSFQLFDTRPSIRKACLWPAMHREETGRNFSTSFLFLHSFVGIFAGPPHLPTLKYFAPYVTDVFGWSASNAEQELSNETQSEKGSTNNTHVAKKRLSSFRLIPHLQAGVD